MTGASSDADPGAGPGRLWDVALSFAGAQREYVGQVAATLKARGVRCFYDADEQVRLWGTHLAEELPRIYAHESAVVVVVFISADSAGRPWTRLERRAAFSRAVDEVGVYVLPARFDDSELSGLLPDVVAINLRDYTPEQFADLVVAKLADLGVSPSLVPGGVGRVPAGGVRVSEADPRRLGVHPAISVPGMPDEVLPEYVPRDADAAEFGVRAKVTAAEERGGFVLLIGGSSVGKTRCAFEAVRALLPDWWLVHPAGPEQVVALAAAPPPRTVVWLDELQRYLDGEHGLTGGMVRALLNAPHPAVIIGTLWPDRYIAYTTMPEPGGADPHAREREVLDLAAVIRISPQFSPAEQDQARAAAARDRRLQVALGAAGYGLTQTLAAAPQLVARWEDAETVNPYAWAVLTAALDAARLGARAPLSADFLRAAAPGYCTGAQQAEAPDDWFKRALAYAADKLYGAVAALSPVGSHIGQVGGYIVADYLVQHASRERRYVRVPASTWDAVLNCIRDPADTARLADSARGRLLYCYAIPLYHHAADASDTDGHAARTLAELLERRGDLDGAEQVLRARADAGDGHAAYRLAELLAECGDLDGLRARADAGDRYAAHLLAELLERRGDLDGAEQVLRAADDADDWDTAWRLAILLTEKRGDLDALRARADAGDRYAAQGLAELLVRRGDLDGLRARADAGDSNAAERLAKLLAERGDLDGAVEILRARADVGDGHAAYRLAELLAEHGDLDGAVRVAVQCRRARADAGDRDATWVRLPDWFDEFFAFASSPLADLLAERGDLDGLRALADAGDWSAARGLAKLLAGRGDLDEAAPILRARAHAGDPNAAGQLAELLAERGDLDELRARADAGDGNAAQRLAKLLAERGDLDGLRARADAGDGNAAQELAELLAERSDLDGLRARADAGDGNAARRLTKLLAERSDLDGLRARADVGDGDADLLADLLIRQGRSEEAKRLHRFGLNPDGSIACA
jgi:predicted component of type VI protein secretion system